MKRLSLMLLMLLMITATRASAVDRYVIATGGATSGACPSGTPCTIQFAASIVNPGDVVLCADGNYVTTDTGANRYVLHITRTGSSGNKITFKSINKWGAKLDGQLSGQSYTSIGGIRVEMPDSANGYIIIKNFDIFNLREVGIYVKQGHDVDIIGNRIRDIGRKVCSGVSPGLDGIFFQSDPPPYYVRNVLIDGNWLNDIGRLTYISGAIECCGCVLSLPHNDHGVYFSGDQTTIRNNVFYNIRTGWDLSFYHNNSRNVKIYGNTISGHLIGDAVSPGNIVVGYTSNPVPRNENLLVRDNIFHQTRSPIIHASGNDVVSGDFSYNLTDGANGSVIDYIQPTFARSNNVFTTDAGFVNVQSSGGVITGTPDFHLLPNSPCINTGTILSELGFDYEGNIRPVGSAVDIGAFEFLGAPAAITNLIAASNPAGSEITISFTSPCCTATEYDVRVSNELINAGSFDNEVRITSGISSPAAAGAGETFVLTGFCSGRNYNVAIKTKNSFAWSTISNVASCLTSGVYDSQCAEGWIQ